MGRSAQLERRVDLTKEAPMHENPRATEEEQELAQSDWMDEDEEQRSGYAPADEADDEAERDEPDE